MVQRMKRAGRAMTAICLITVLLCSCGGKQGADKGLDNSGKITVTEATGNNQPGNNQNGNTPNVTDTPTPEPVSPQPDFEDDFKEMPKAGVHTMENLFATAIQPLGKTMYIWGGGWNKEDTGAGEEAVSFGISEKWVEFASMQNSSYDYNNTRYQIHNGLDCSGYIGWLVYNVIETQEGRPGYVMKSTDLAKSLAEKGFGTYNSGAVSEWLPGDVASMKGHVWLCLGSCDDGSVLVLHASPPGVKLSGTVLADGSRSQAVALAEKIMKNCYSSWYDRFPDCTVPYSYLTKSHTFRWSRNVLSDKWGLGNMSAEELAEKIFLKN